MIAKGEFIDLTPYVNIVPEMMDDKTYDQGFWQATMMLGENQRIALPIDGEGMNLFYNLNVFDEAGVPYPTDDFTWDDFLTVSQQLTKTEGDKTTQFGTPWPL